MNYNLYLSLLLMATACCLLFIAYLAWRRREFPISISLFFGMWAGAFYSFGYAFEIVSSSFEQFRFWLRIEYIGISFGTLVWFIMVLQYTNRQAVLRKWVIALLAVVPVLTFVSHYTNEWHHLFYKSMSLDESEGFPLVSLVAGPLYKLHVAYAYILFFIGMGLLFLMYKNSESPFRKQIALMMIGSCGPYAITGIYLSGMLNTPIDISPFGFLFSGVFYLWAIYQTNLLKLAPLALQKVFESMKDAVIVFDLDNRITNFNQSARQIIRGLSEKKVIGQSAAHIFHQYPDLLEKIMKVPSVENKVTISGSSEFYDVYVSYVRDRSQKPVGKMLLLSDVTETVLVEEMLRTNARQLSELNAFKDKMFTVVAHDIRNPLAVLVNLMELLRDEMLVCGQYHKEIVHEMELQIQNTFSLAESLLDWFRSQREGMMFNPVICNLSQAVQANVSLLNVHSAGKRIQIHTSFSNDTFVYADKSMLDLIIRNLLTNAIKFSDYGGNIQISGAQTEDEVVISVRNIVKGGSPDQMNRLLQNDDPVSQMGTAGERGTGLGLALCKEFVRMNGGAIWVESTPDRGSMVSFSVPAVDGGASPAREGGVRRSAG